MRALCLAICLAASTLAAPAGAYNPDDLLFYAPFDGSAVAQKATGDPSPTGEVTADFTDGLIGRAVLVGGEHPRLRYASEGNIDWMQGTISCLVTPVDWSLPGEAGGMIVQTRNPTDQPNLYLGTLTSRSRGTNFQVYFVYPGVAAPMAGALPEWPQGQRRHLVATWQPGELSIYLDGELLASSNDFAPRPLGADSFSVGPHRPHNPEAPSKVSAVDEFMVFRRALRASEVRALTDELQQRSTRRAAPLLRVGTCAAPPTIDGKLDDPAWTRAAGLTGLSNIFHQRLSGLPTTVRVCRDSERLYIAYQCAIPEGATPRGSTGERDTGSPWHEDSLEVFLAPDPARPDDHYQLVANCAGLILDLHSGQKSWDGDWQVATSVTADHWCAEVSIPFASLGVAPPGPGQLWRANFCRDVAIPAKAYESWADVGQTYKAPELFGWLEFSEGPVAQVTGLGRPDFGRLEVAASIANPTAEPVTVEFEARLLKPGTTLSAPGEEWGVTVRGKMLSERREVTVSAGGVEQVSLARDFLDPELRLLQVSARIGEAELYRHELPVTLEPPVALRTEDVPSQQRLRLWVFTGGLPDADRAQVAAQVTVADAAGRRAAEATVPLPGIEEMVWLDYAEWPGGDYTIAATVAQDGEELGRASVAFTRAERPEWFGNDIGTARVVIPPFSPMRYPDAKSVECWGRRMSFDEGLLPASMTSSGEELLAGPIRVLLGGDQVRCANGPIFAEQAEDRAEFTLSGSPLRAECWQEYDGFTWFTLTCPEPPEQPVQSLTIEIPLAREHARMIHGTTNERRGGINRFIGDEPMQFGFLPMLWVGSNDRGLCWCAESEQGWVPLSATDAIELVPGDDAVTLRCRIIAEPTRLTGDWSVGFGLIATPVKPLPRGWSTLIYDVLPASRRTIQWEPMGIRQDLGTIWNNSFAEHLTDPLHPKPELAQVVAQARELGISPFAYIAPNVHTMQHEEPARYLAEWRVEPVHEFYEWPGETYTTLCFRGSWQDYLLAGYKHLVGEFKMDGVYHDGGGPALCHNELHGCGWQDPAGGRHQVRDILACRAFHKRTATMLYHDLGIENYVIFEHTSDVTWLPTQTFLTQHFDGEQYKGSKLAKVPYTEILSLEEVRPEYIATQWGIPQVFLNICDRKSDEGRADSETFLAYMLPGGVPFYSRYCHEELVVGIYTMWRDFGAREAEFVPYWRDVPGLSSQADRELVQVSSYRVEGKVLIVAGNTSAEAQSVTVDLDRGALGLAGDATVRRAFPDRPTALEGGRLSFEVPAHSFAMVWVE